jgi:hypothetical protein
MNKRILSCVVPLFISATTAFGQSFYMAAKTQIYLQSSASAPSSFTNMGAYFFTSQAPSAATVTPPGLSGLAMAYNSGDNNYVLKSAYPSKAAFDAAFPNGSYRMSGTGFPTATISMTGDLYPTVPQVTNGTWQNGVLVIDPSQSYTVNFNTFSTYATGGIAGYMSLQITSESGNDNVNIGQAYTTVQGTGSTVSPTPFTSYVIPAGTLRAGLPYRLVIGYDTVTTYDMTTIPGSGIVGMYERTLIVYVVAKSSTTIAPPTIVTQPVSQAVVAGSAAQFAPTVTFSGSTYVPANTSVFWYFVDPRLGPGIVGGNAKYTNVGGFPCGITVNSVSSSDVGSYYLEVINGGGVAFTQNVSLSIVTSPPAITAQPTASQSVNAGANVTLSVTATSAGSYQWRQNGNAVAGATNATLSLSNIGTTQEGNYTVVVTNSLGSVTSSTASVSVAVNSFLYNISTVGYVGTGANQDLDAGFYTNGSGTKKIVVRGIGPNLAALDAKDYSGLTLTNPQLILNSSTSPLSTTTAWGGAQALVSAFATVYAASFPSGSNDAAISPSVPAGPGIGYTADVKSANGGSGVAQIEVYDYDSYVSTPTSHLINISTRGYVGTGLGTGASQFQFLDAGFWTIGSTSETVLIRAVGPAEAVNFPGGNLAKPLLTLYDSSGNVIATNSAWGTAPVAGNSTVAAGIQPATTAIMNSVYASTIAPGSNDCAMVVTLPANNGYTAKVTSADSASTGIALVEVYDLPP